MPPRPSSPTPSCRRATTPTSAATTSTCSGAGRDPALARAFAAGRAEVDDAVERLVALVGAPTSAAVTIALVDGAVVSALTEHRPVRPTAQALLVAAWGR